MASTYSRRSLAAIALLLCLPLVRAADAPAKGDLWEVTTRMSMEGMPMQMPAQTGKFCSARVWTRPPAADNPNQKCTRTAYTVSGSKVSWTESCVGPTMTGKGEITRQGEDAYTGTIQYASAQGNMTINLSGRKIGSCDNPT
jgi:hypothetical protein